MKFDLLELTPRSLKSTKENHVSILPSWIFSVFIRRFLADSTVADDENFTINVYATNYNYLLIQGGMAGLAYSN